MTGKGKQQVSRRKGCVSSDDIAALLQYNTSHIPPQAPTSLPPQAPRSMPPQGAHATSGTPSRVVPSPVATSTQAPPYFASPSVPTYLQTPPPTIGLTSHTLGNSPTIDNGDGEPRPTLSESTRPTLSESTPSSSGSSPKPPLSVKGGHFDPEDGESVNIIGGLIMGKYDGFWPTYLDVPPDVRQNWWIEFKKHWSISDDDEGPVRKVYEKKMARRFSDILHDAHKVYDAKGKKKNGFPNLCLTSYLSIGRVKNS